MAIPIDKQLSIIIGALGDNLKISTALSYADSTFPKLFGLRTPEPAFDSFLTLAADDIRAGVKERLGELVAEFPARRVAGATGTGIERINSDEFIIRIWDCGQLMQETKCDATGVVEFLGWKLTLPIPRFQNVWKLPQ